MDTHHMVRIRTDRSGVDEWHCPTCGRRLLLRWPPDYSRTVLDHGNPDVPHTGEAGVRITGTGLRTEHDDAPAPLGDRAWLAELGIRWDEPDD